MNITFNYKGLIVIAGMILLPLLIISTCLDKKQSEKNYRATIAALSDSLVEYRDKEGKQLKRLKNI